MTRIVASAGGRTVWPTQGNEVFAILNRGWLAAAREAGATFYEWPADSLALEQRPAVDEALVRLVTSFATSEAG